MSRRSGLGRGLGALIPSDLVAGAGDAFRDLPLNQIEPNRYQPREQFDEAALVALSDSIRELGVLQPVLVRPGDGEMFELIAGERRWRAARRAGLMTIPAIIRTVDDNASLEQALVENLHRQDLNALEEAAAYQQLMEDFGLTQEQVAARVGKSRPAIANTLRLLQLPPSSQRLLAEGRLTAGHARALLATPDRNLQEQLAARAVAEGWTVRALEQTIRTETWASQHPDEPSAELSSVELSSVEPTSTEASFAGAPTDEAPSQDDIVGDDLALGPDPGPDLGEVDTSPTGDVASSENAGPPVQSGRTVVAQPERELRPAGLLELEQLLADHFETTVRISGGRGRGRITIDFADVADLERIYRLIVHDE